MSNVIAMNNWIKNTEEEIRILHREEDDPEMVPVKYMYGDNEEGLCGTHSIIDHRDFASIVAVREDIQKQREALETGFDKFGEEIDFYEIVPWDEDDLLVCQEGVFVWDWNTEDYELIGKVRRTERRKIVTFKDNFAVKMGQSNILLNPGIFYHIDGEYIAYTEDRNPVVMLVINANDSIPLAVPYDPSVLWIYPHDYALIVGIHE
ncbi:hypothetical protein [Brevibacillus choshinensis]|uniref:Uncharacterized protein n=1 Tax=Brevibacillus choshinensis TaxID=54911 RepID=A0ABX7FID4_BRECH|nr:hypothetical protein [Brevibacillus choshinensis]QRG65988.1 hypothetical protein JNE38_20740 [Brevibacillus choshinensis]